MKANSKKIVYITAITQRQGGGWRQSARPWARTCCCLSVCLRVITADTQHTQEVTREVIMFHVSVQFPLPSVAWVASTCPCMALTGHPPAEPGLFL